MSKQVIAMILLTGFATAIRAETGWYVSGDAGSYVSNTKSRLTRGAASTIDSSMYDGVPAFDYDKDGVYGVALGRSISHGLRVEAEWRQRSSEADAAIQQGTGVRSSDTFQIDAEIKSTSLMLNGLYALPTRGNLKPYLKAGVGLAQHKADAGLAASITAFGIPRGAANPYPENTKTDFAWALGLGTAWYIAPKTALDFKYQYINMGDAKTGADRFSDTVNSRVKGHELTVGLTYRF